MTLFYFFEQIYNHFLSFCVKVLKKTIGTDRSIILKPNVSFNELYKLNKLATFYWHFTGFGINEDQHPELVEHLGIAPLEAMASGCVVFCYNAGGPKELVKDGENGFLFSNEKELIKKTRSVVENFDLRQRVVSNAQKYFKERVRGVLSL